MSRGETLLYVVLPYAAIAVFVAGTAWRFRYDRYGRGARSTQLLESRVLRYGSTIFHFGLLAAIAGHVLGILVPQSWTSAVGISDGAYHVLAVAGGVTAGFAVAGGFAILVYRRIAFSRVRATTTGTDVLTFALLGLAILSGLLATILNIGDSVHYRESVAPYFRSLFVLDPRPELMTGEGVSLIFQLHLTVVWLLFAVWPLSRLVHAWSVPVDYTRRSPVLYRARAPRPPQPQRQPTQISN